jgi:hypothetical protein
MSGRGGTSGPRERQPLGADVLTVATAVIHADASPHHADHERGERAGEGAERPSGVATDGGAYESQQFGHDECADVIDESHQRTTTRGTGYVRQRLT